MKRDLHIKDSTGQMEVTLWGKTNCSIPMSLGSAIQLERLRTKKFMGVLKLATSPSSQVMVILTLQLMIVNFYRHGIKLFQMFHKCVIHCFDKNTRMQVFPISGYSVTAQNCKIMPNGHRRIFRVWLCHRMRGRRDRGYVLLSEQRSFVTPTTIDYCK